MMQVSPGPWDSPAVIMRSAIGAVGYGRRPAVSGAALPRRNGLVAPGGVDRDR